MLGLKVRIMELKSATALGLDWQDSDVHLRNQNAVL
jgi:hypothetical protein